MIVKSIAGIVTDWSQDNPNGSYAASIDAPFNQPPLTTIMVSRDSGSPIGTAVRQDIFRLPPITVQIMDEENQAPLRIALLAALDTSRSFKALITADDDGQNERYWMCSFETREELDEARGTGQAFVVTAVVVRDPYARRTEISTATENLSASGQTIELVNNGHMDTYATVNLDLNAARSGANHWLYRRFVLVRWWSDSPAVNYPVSISGNTGSATVPWDTTGLTPTKAIDETSVGVIVDGTETDRWFSEEVEDNDKSFDQVDTRLWINLDFQGRETNLTLADGFGNAAGDVTGGIRVNQDISSFPFSGILYTPSGGEIFRYTSRDIKTRTFYGITRAAYGSTANSSSAGAAIEWIQHEIFIVYGPATNLAKVPDDTYRPFIELFSSWNKQWYWATGYNYPDPIPLTGWTSLSEPTRSGKWQAVTGGAGTIYTGEENSGNEDPVVVLGLKNTTAGPENFARWEFFTPSTITQFTAQARWYETTAVDAVKLYGSDNGVSWTLVESYPPVGGEGWFEFPLFLSSNAEWKYLRVEIAGAIGEMEIYEAALSHTNTWFPTVTLYPEVVNYALDMTLTNETTGESIHLDIPAGLSPGNYVEINSENKTVIVEPFLINMYRAVTKSDHRPDFLRLVPGENVIMVAETGLTNVDVVASWPERLYA